jgi:hypothetical protein
MAQLVPDDRTRQGGSGRPVLGVLIGSLLLGHDRFDHGFVQRQSDQPDYACQPGLSCPGGPTLRQRSAEAVRLSR